MGQGSWSRWEPAPGRALGPRGRLGSQHPRPADGRQRSRTWRRSQLPARPEAPAKPPPHTQTRAGSGPRPPRILQWQARHGAHPHAQGWWLESAEGRERRRCQRDAKRTPGPGPRERGEGSKSPCGELAEPGPRPRAEQSLSILRVVGKVGVSSAASQARPGLL